MRVDQRLARAECGQNVDQARLLRARSGVVRVVTARAGFAKVLLQNGQTHDGLLEWKTVRGFSVAYATDSKMPCLPMRMMKRSVVSASCRLTTAILSPLAREASVLTSSSTLITQASLKSTPRSARLANSGRKKAVRDVSASRSDLESLMEKMMKSKFS